MDQAIPRVIKETIVGLLHISYTIVKSRTNIKKTLNSPRKIE